MALPIGNPVSPNFDKNSTLVAPIERQTNTKARKPWRHVIIALTGIVGMATSIGMFLAIGTWQAHVAEVRFSSLASDHLQTINSGLEGATDLLYSLRAHFESLDHLPSRGEFQAFSHDLRERVPGLRDTGWAPRITTEEREAFERGVRASGISDFQIKERNSDGKLVRAQERAEYFPILYSEPGPANRPVLGFDLASEAVRRGTIARALSNDKVAATPPVKLMNIKRPNGGLMMFIAVRPAKAADGGPSRPIAGIVLGAVETAAMIENILATKVRLVGLDMYVFDPDGPVGERLIYWHSTTGKPAPSEASLLAMRHWQGTLQMVDQPWGTILTPSDPTDDGIADQTANMVLIGGLIMTISIVAYLWFSLRRTQQLERLTTDLRVTTEELRRNGVKLDHLARHDVLTGLSNRMAFRDEVASGLRRARRGQGMAVLYLDLDRFKAVNDTLGHPAGDRLLCEVADRLRKTVREADTITRLGGDEFAVAQIEVQQPASAETLARRLLDVISRPYKIDGQWVVVGVSIGITLAEREDVDVDQLLRRADMALYAAKRDGRGTWRFFAKTMEFDALAQRGLEMDLRHALEHDELELYYQPQVTIADGQVRGFEALLRWHHPDRGMVMPGDFIRCAEETGLIVPIGAWVLRTALRQAVDWPDDVRVAVNLSPCQLARDDLVETVKAALAASGQSGARLELEITENALMEQYAAGQTAMKQLRALGVRIAMDDFGTGYASISHLRRFSFDRIKVDRSFIAGMTDSPQGNAIVRAILQLATTMNIATLAEGVETQAQLEQLAAMGCNEAQGFLFSPAQTASAVPRLLAGWRPERLSARPWRADGTTPFDEITIHPP
jgi:diguanylate cyclase (GGDEF)-like protein